MEYVRLLLIKEEMIMEVTQLSIINNIWGAIALRLFVKLLREVAP